MSVLSHFSEEELLAEILTRGVLSPAPSTIRLIDPTYKIKTIGIGPDNSAGVFLTEDDIDVLLSDHSSEKVLSFKGRTSLNVSVRDVLLSAIDKVNDVVVIGWTEDKQLFFALSNADAAEAVLLLETAKTKVIDSLQEN